MKKFITGFLTAALLFTALPIGAAIEEYICYRADYKVMVNGEQYISEDLPILNYKGSTYAPFRSILEAAGLAVEWDAELNQAEVTAPDAPTKEVEAMEYDATTGLPVGAEHVDYKGCTTAIEYNGNTFMSRPDLSKYLGVKYEGLDVKTQTTTYSNGGESTIVDMTDPTKYFVTKQGTPYINVNQF